MPSGKIPKGKPVGSAAQRSTIKTFTVKRSGPRNEISSATAASTSSQQQPVQPPGITLREPGLDRPDYSFTAEDTHSLPNFIDEVPPSVPMVGLEELIEDLDEILYEAPRRGKVCSMIPVCFN